MDDIRQQLTQKLTEILDKFDLAAWLSAAVLLVLGLILARLARSVFTRSFGRVLNPQHRLLAAKVLYYSLVALAVVGAVQKTGVADLSIFLGAAGILTVALGFASQTSASNLISGLFLVSEKAFEVGDLIQVGTTEGWVESIDLLSVKLRTFNNLLIRVPNETLLKSELVNLTYYPIRRLDVKLGVAYKEDIGHVRRVLEEVAEKNPHALDEPKPIFFFRGYGDSAVLLQFSVWFTRDNYWEPVHRLQQEIKEALDRAGIEIPFPHLSLYTGSVTEPFPVRRVAH